MKKLNEVFSFFSLGVLMFVFMIAVYHPTAIKENLFWVLAPTFFLYGALAIVIFFVRKVIEKKEIEIKILRDVIHRLSRLPKASDNASVSCNLLFEIIDDYGIVWWNHFSYEILLWLFYGRKSDNSKTMDYILEFITEATLPDRQKNNPVLLKIRSVVDEELLTRILAQALYIYAEDLVKGIFTNSVENVAAALKDEVIIADVAKYAKELVINHFSDEKEQIKMLTIIECEIIKIRVL